MLVWVTGVGGQVGHAVLQALACAKIPHFGTTRAEVDIAHESEVRKTISKGVTHIINPAAFTAVDPAETERERAYQANVIGPQRLAEAAREKNAKLIHISTDYVFDGSLNRPYREEDETRPLGWYAITKTEGEVRVLKTLPNACIVRVSWVFGGQGRHYGSFMLDLMRQRKELRVVDDQLGRPTYVHDLAKALIAFLDKEGIYHYANSGIVSKCGFTAAMWEWARQRKIPLMCERIVPISASEFPSAAKRPLYTPFDTSKAEAFLSIRSWREGFEEYMNHALL